MVISRETQRGIFRFLISARRKVACKRLVISINFKASLLLFFSSRRRHTIYWLDWSSDVCFSDPELTGRGQGPLILPPLLKLTSVEGGEDPTRRRLRRSELAPKEQAVVDAFVEARLLTSGKSEGGGDRKGVVWGKSVDLGGRRIIKKKETVHRREG